MGSRRGREWRARGGAARWVLRTQTLAVEAGGDPPYCMHQITEVEGGRGCAQCRGKTGVSNPGLCV